MAITLLSKYRNGNYDVKIFSDGTKIRKTEDDDFNPIFPESIDLKITSYCDANCPECHENATVLGRHANLNLPFLVTLPRGTEVAIGGGNPLSHPELISFLKKMKEQGVICNITINQDHLIKNYKFVQKMIDEKLVHGIGISYMAYSEELINFCHKNTNAVLHLILGIHSVDVLDELSNKNLKILFLGYKKFGRGEDFYSVEVDKKIARVNKGFDKYKNKFKVICLDNLGYTSLEIDKRISKEERDKYYMGDDGMFTMYVDAVEETYAPNSITPKKERKSLKNNIIEMFRDIRRKL